MNHEIEFQQEEELTFIGELIAIVTRQVQIIADLLSRKQTAVIQVFVTVINNQKFIIMNPLQLQVGFQAPILEQLVDAVKLQPIAGATMVPKSKVSDNPAAATVDASGNLVAVAAGSGNLTDINTWTYTDPVTGQQVTADVQTIAPFVVAAATGGSNVVQQVALGTPVPIANPVAGSPNAGFFNQARHTGPAR